MRFLQSTATEPSDPCFHRRRACPPSSVPATRGALFICAWGAVVAFSSGVVAADYFKALATMVTSPRQSQEAKRVTADTARRKLAEDAGDAATLCEDPDSFLGVGNPECLHENIGTAIFLLGLIVVLSIFFTRLIYYVRHAIDCPQLSKIVNRIFQEVMVMGVITLVIFALHTSGAMEKMHFSADSELSASEQLHFYEFFHYIVFFTMIYFIAIVLLLLFIGTIVPKLLWKRHSSVVLEEEGAAEHQDDDVVGEPCDDGDAGVQVCRTIDGRFTSGEQIPASKSRTHAKDDVVERSRAHSRLLEQYQRDERCFRFNLKKQWHVWSSFETLAYHICQSQSGYIYKNPHEMERLFGVKPHPRRPSSTLSRRDSLPEPMTYARYHVLCTRNMLLHITELHLSALFLLIVISFLPLLFPSSDHWVFIGVGGILFVVHLVLFFKVLKILRGMVDDRLPGIMLRDRLAHLPIEQEECGTRIKNRRDQTEIVAPPKRLTLKAVAVGVRAVVRMKMSARSQRQLRHHDDHFWFGSPIFLLRLFEFATIGQAFYLVWLSLVEAPTVLRRNAGDEYLLPIMVLLPFLTLCVITPVTLPRLVLVMSLTGIFVDLNSKPGPSKKQKKRLAQSPQAARPRRWLPLRRPFLKSHHADTVAECPRSPEIHDANQEAIFSPTSVYLRINDSPNRL